MEKIDKLEPWRSDGDVNELYLSKSGKYSIFILLTMLLVLAASQAPLFFYPDPSVLPAAVRMLVMTLMMVGILGSIFGVIHFYQCGAPWIYYALYKSQSPEKRKKSQLWFEEIRIARHASIQSANVLFLQFNDHLDRLAVEEKEPGEKEELAYAALMDLKAHIKKQAKLVQIDLRAEGRKIVDVPETYEAIDRLGELTGSQRASDSSKMVAALEVESASWNSDTTSSSQSTADHMRRSRAALAKARQVN